MFLQTHTDMYSTREIDLVPKAINLQMRNANRFCKYAYFALEKKDHCQSFLSFCDEISETLSSSLFLSTDNCPRQFFFHMQIHAARTVAIIRH